MLGFPSSEFPSICLGEWLETRFEHNHQVAFNGTRNPNYGRREPLVGIRSSAVKLRSDPPGYPLSRCMWMYVTELWTIGSPVATLVGLGRARSELSCPFRRIVRLHLEGNKTMERGHSVEWGVYSQTTKSLGSGLNTHTMVDINIITVEYIVSDKNKLKWHRIIPD